MVKYSTSNDSLHFYGEYLLSGDDIEAVNKTYSVQLKGLSPGTKYYFVVTANNSCQSNKPVLCFFRTNETGDIYG